MYVTDFGNPIQQAAVSRLRKNVMSPSVDDMITTIRNNMRNAPSPSSAQVARIYAALSGMNLGRSRGLSNNGMQTLPYRLNSVAPVYETLPARKSYPNDTLQLLLNKLGQGQ